MRALRSWLGLVGTLTLAGLVATAGAQPVGSEFQINTYTTSNQQSAAVAADASGNFVVVWQSDGQDGSGSGVFGQRYDSGGRALGSEFRVNSFTPENQADPSVAADASGGFVVVWGHDGIQIFGQRYDSAGDPLGSEFQVSSFGQDPDVASDASGNFVVVWRSLDADGWGVFGQRYDSAGAPRGGEFRVNSYTGWHQWFSSVASDASGNFVVAWQSLLPGGSDYEIVAQRFDSGGMALGAEFRVNSYTTSHQEDPAVASDASGSFVIVWDGVGRERPGISGQRYDSGGMALGTEFRVISHPKPTGSASVAYDASGNFIVVWQRLMAWRHNNPDIFGRRYDNAGEPLGVEFAVNSYTTGEQRMPTVAATGVDEFVVAWESLDQDGFFWGVFGRRFDFGGDASPAPPQQNHDSDPD